MWHNDDRPRIDFVNVRCTAATASMLHICDYVGTKPVCNILTTGVGLTYVINAFIRMVLSLVVKLLRISLARIIYVLYEHWLKCVD